MKKKLLMALLVGSIGCTHLSVSCFAAETAEAADAAAAEDSSDEEEDADTEGQMRNQQILMIKRRNDYC